MKKRDGKMQQKKTTKKERKMKDIANYIWDDELAASHKIQSQFKMQHFSEAQIL